MDLSEQINLAPSQEDFEPFLELTPELATKRRSQGRIIFDRFIRNRVAIAGATFLFVLFLFCFLGPLITGHNQPDVLHLNDTSLPPSVHYPFGTDNVGRDQLARAMVGGQVSLLVGLSSMFVAILLGVSIGAL